MKLLDFARRARPAFQFDWFHELLLSLLERCASGDPEVENLLISLPPGSGKTELIMILFSAWLIAHNPLREHVIALSNADNLARMACANTLRVLAHPDIEERFPLAFDKETESQFTIKDSDGRPAMYSASIMGQVTGARATMLLYDDLVKNLEVAYSQPQLDKIWDNFSAVAETRLLPTGKIVGIGTRWCLRDVHQRLIERAVLNPLGRQFVYVNLAAWNTGEDSYIFNTRTGQRTFLPKYKAMAKIPGQPYSFTRRQLEGKRVDVGPNLWSALYMGNPLATDSQLFPPEAWATYDERGINTDEIAMIATSWDFASKTGSSNDYSANVVIAKTNAGQLLVLDVWKSKVEFSQLPDIVLQRYRSVAARWHTVPALVCEDASAGTQVIQLFQSRFPAIPLIAAKPVKSKLIRAEAVTVLTRSGCVALPKNAVWRDAFVSELAAFPVGQHDDVVDAFVHGCKTFVSSGDFRPTEFLLTPGSTRPQSNAEIIDEIASEFLETQPAFGICISPELDEIDRGGFDL